MKVMETKTGMVEGLKVLIGFIPDTNPPEEGPEGTYGSWKLIGYGNSCPDEMPPFPSEYGPFIRSPLPFGSLPSGFQERI